LLSSLSVLIDLVPETVSHLSLELCLGFLVTAELVVLYQLLLGFSLPQLFFILPFLLLLVLQFQVLLLFHPVFSILELFEDCLMLYLVCYLSLNIFKLILPYFPSFLIRPSNLSFEPPHILNVFLFIADVQPSLDLLLYLSLP